MSQTVIFETHQEGKVIIEHCKFDTQEELHALGEQKSRRAYLMRARQDSLVIATEKEVTLVFEYNRVKGGYALSVKPKSPGRWAVRFSIDLVNLVEFQDWASKKVFSGHYYGCDSKFISMSSPNGISLIEGGIEHFYYMEEIKDTEQFLICFRPTEYFPDDYQPKS